VGEVGAGEGARAEDDAVKNKKNGGGENKVDFFHCSSVFKINSHTKKTLSLPRFLSLPPERRSCPLAQQRLHRVE
jgi:hypothetical protein